MSPGTTYGTNTTMPSTRTMALPSAPASVTSTSLTMMFFLFLLMASSASFVSFFLSLDHSLSLNSGLYTKKEVLASILLVLCGKSTPSLGGLSALAFV